MKRKIYLDKGLVWHTSGDLAIGILGIFSLAAGLMKIFAGDPAQRMRRDLGEYSTSGYIMALLGIIWIVHAIRKVFEYKRERRAAELENSPGRTGGTEEPA